MISNKNENRSIKLSEKVIEFKSHLIKDQEQRIKKSIECEIIDISDVKNIDENIIGLYPTVGENLDYLNSNNIKLNFLYRKLDQFSCNIVIKVSLILKIIFQKLLQCSLDEHLFEQYLTLSQFNLHFFSI